jgi:hypothetical protein
MNGVARSKIPPSPHFLKDRLTILTDIGSNI